jgi:hypothetical protein
MSAESTFGRLKRYLRDNLSSEPSPRKPVFWLGAGCSVSDGIPVNDELLQQVLAGEGPSWGSPQFRFDQYVRLLGPGGRRAHLLEPFFKRTIRRESPYHHLAHLLKRGYADVVFTFNIDDLLEQALDASGLQKGAHYSVFHVPELRAELLKPMMSQGKRIQVVKLHGDYKMGFNYMTSDEVIAYEETIRNVVTDYSNKAAVVCGYSFFHLNVLNSFKAQKGEPVFYVNKTFPSAPMVLSLLYARYAEEPLIIDESLGCFEEFAHRLARELP